MADETEPSTALAEMKLRALARACVAASGDRSDAKLELATVDPSVGAAVGSVSSDGAGAERIAFYLAGEDGRAIGPATRWAESQRATRVEVLAEGNGPDLARRAALLNPGAPRVGVWDVDGAEVSPASAAPAPPPPPVPENHWALAGVMSEAGARPVDDHGLLIAEVAGLEVGRVVDVGEGPTIDVGVGQADRELNHLVHREPDPGRSLRRVIAAVVEYRRPTSHHPLTRIARERWLRSMLLEQPELVGAEDLAPLVPLRRRGGLSVSEPAAAAGTRRETGRPVVVVTMVGVDLDLVPEAADYRQRWNPEADLILAMPQRDLRLSTALLARLDAAEAVALTPPWV